MKKIVFKSEILRLIKYFYSLNKNLILIAARILRRKRNKNDYLITYCLLDTVINNTHHLSHLILTKTFCDSSLCR